MESYALFNFAVRREFEVEGKKHQRVYQLELQPGSPWDEIADVLDEFKVEMALLKEQAKSKEDAEKAAANAEPIEPEIVA